MSWHPSPPLFPCSCPSLHLFFSLLFPTFSPFYQPPSSRSPASASDASQLCSAQMWEKIELPAHLIYHCPPPWRGVLGGGSIFSVNRISFPSVSFSSFPVFRANKWRSTKLHFLFFSEKVEFPKPKLENDLLQNVLEIILEIIQESRRLGSLPLAW